MKEAKLNEEHNEHYSNFKHHMKCYNKVVTGMANEI